MDFERLSRTVAHALRHEPWKYELEMDDQGWAPVDQLGAAHGAGVHFYRGNRHVWLSDRIPPSYLKPEEVR